MNAITPKVDVDQVNAIARAQVLNQSIEMIQEISSGTISGSLTAANATINIAPRNVGLIKGFILTVSAPIVVSTTSSTATLTQFGPANILSQVTFYDLNNNIRIQTTGWHINAVNSAKSRRVFASAVTTDSPINYASNWERIIDASATIVTAGSAVTSTMYMMYYIPLAYSDVDLRGAVYANVVNATMNLQLVFNPDACVASGGVASAVYSGVAGVVSGLTYKVYQVYLDQLPMGKQGPILPPLDLSTIYMIQNTTLTSMVASQDFPLPYANFREFLSTTVIWNNGGTLNTGSDVNYWGLQSANYTFIWKLDPYVVAMRARQEIGDDFPDGTYYFSHRNKPISTIQYGNMQMILNASTVNSNASCMVGWEMFAYVNQIVGAGSLPAG